mgnify:CR=1 FL=1
MLITSGMFTLTKNTFNSLAGLKNILSKKVISMACFRSCTTQLYSLDTNYTQLGFSKCLPCPIHPNFFHSLTFKIAHENYTDINYTKLQNS